MPGTVLSMQNIYLVKKNYANLPEGDTKPPEDSASMKFVYHQLNTESMTISDFSELVTIWRIFHSVVSLFNCFSKTSFLSTTFEFDKGGKLKAILTSGMIL